MVKGTTTITTSVVGALVVGAAHCQNGCCVSFVSSTFRNSLSHSWDQKKKTGIEKLKESTKRSLDKQRKRKKTQIDVIQRRNGDFTTSNRIAYDWSTSYCMQDDATVTPNCDWKLR